LFFRVPAISIASSSTAKFGTSNWRFFSLTVAAACFIFAFFNWGNCAASLLPRDRAAAGPSGGRLGCGCFLQNAKKYLLLMAIPTQ
jgi:hypothetical protein